MNDQVRTPHIPAASPSTSALVAFLRDCDRTEVTYRELSAVARCDVQRAGRGYLHSARRRLLMDNGQLWDSVRGKGLRRLVDEEKVIFMEHKRDHINRTSTRIRNVGQRVKVENIPEDKRSAFFALLAANKTISMFASPAAQRKMVEAGILRPSDMKKLLDTFPRSKDES